MLRSEPGPATASVHTAPTAASATRPSRLRGLSYLRNYTHTHLHSSSSRAETPPLTRSTSSPPEPSPTSNSAAYQTSAEQSTPATIHSGENGWIPTIQGRSGLSRESLHLTSTSTEPAESERSRNAGMTRNRAATALGPTPATTSRSRHVSVGGASGTPSTMPETAAIPGASKEQMPTIRLIPHVEARSIRPSLSFTAVSRTLQTHNSVVRVGRYSERDDRTGEPNKLPVGFKSKVVSRRHCEFWCTDGQWYIKDVKSSSGTFLNHVRLSSPGQESRPYPVNDGDVVQLGIDFKGGEEIIFRCVKIRVECNRSWQKSLNNFNTSAHKRLFKSSKNRDSDAASVNSSECSICLNPVAPCQALFVAPCSHVWHYKCVRNLIHGPTWPHFLCPNCRAFADLEADVEQPEEYEEEPIPEELLEQSNGHADLTPSEDSADNDPSLDDDDENQMKAIQQENSLNLQLDPIDVEDFTATFAQASLSAPGPTESNGRSPPSSSSSSSSSDNSATHTPKPSSTQSIPIAPATASASRNGSDLAFSPRSATPTSHAQFALSPGPAGEGPTTPRNDVGPFVFDGRAGRGGMEGESGGWALM